MRLLEQRLRAPRPRGRKSVRLHLESLETRLAMSAAVIGPASDRAADAIAMEPAFLMDSTGMIATVDPGSRVVGAQNSGSPSPSGYTPQQIRAAYGLDGISFGSIVGDGTGQTIAIVDAYDDPELVDSSSSGFNSSDLAQFDRTFALPDPPSFQKLNQYGSSTDLPATEPAGAGNSGGSWSIEEALDVEWAHAMAPGANIVLIETNSDNGTDMYTGATTAASLAGVSVVSMSWGASEYAGEQSFDSDFTTPSGHQGVTFVAATGDNGAPGEYPAYSPNVVAAGGTTLSLNSSGSNTGETAWSGGGGGISSYESESAYQQGVENTGRRTIPDIAFDANPSTGVAIYNSDNSTAADPWEQIGGTSVAAPCLSGIFAIADQGRVNAGGTTLDGASQTLPALYALPATDYNDVTSGSNGAFAAGSGYDETTGLGSPKANLLAPDIAAYGVARNLAVVTQPPANVIAGAAFGLSVMVENSDGSLETSYNGSVTVTLATNPGGTDVGGTVTLTAHEGVATFSDLTLDRAASGYTLIVDAGGSAFATTGAITVSPAAATRLVIISGPANGVTVGSPFGLTIAIEDIFGNLETSYTGSVTASLNGGPAKGSLKGTRTVTANQGMAIFSDLAVTRLATGNSVKLTADNGLATAKITLFRSVAAQRNLARPRVRLVRIAPKHAVEPNVHHARKLA